jgi:hypothetical protein
MKNNKIQLLLGLGLLIGTLVFALRHDVCGFAELRLSEIHTDWSHKGLNRVFWYWPTFNQAAENLARGQQDEIQVYNDWSKSASHSANLKGDWTESCLVSDTYQGVNYFVEIYIK